MTSSSNMLRLVIRHTPDNPNHHLWFNNGTWWCHFTLKTGTGISQRIRSSLKTADLQKARDRRDRILSAAHDASGRIAA